MTPKRVLTIALLLAGMLLTGPGEAIAQSPAWETCPWSSSPCCVGDVGDINGDGNNADPVDLAYLVDFLFIGGPAPECDDEADLNQDGAVADPTDLSLLVDILYADVPPLPPCP